MKVENDKIFNDWREFLVSFNNFSLETIKRMYQIEHPNKDVVRAWQGNKIENEWFYVTRGSFAIGYVAIDNFENLSTDILANIKIIKAEDKIVFLIPRRHAKGLKSLEPDFRIIVFSDLTLDEAKNDNFRFDSNLNWDDIN